MKYLKFLFPLIVLLIMVKSTQSGLANEHARWYAGRYQNGGYGGRANIWTPASSPSMAWIDDSGQSSWVSLKYPYWIQTGWHYYYDWNNARKYTESRNYISQVVNQVDQGNIGWGSYAEFKIDHIDYDNW